MSICIFRFYDRIVKGILSYIDSIAFKGYGVTRIGGKVVFVPFTVPKDEGFIEIIEEKKAFSIGTLRKLITPSPWRISPACEHFGKCGGCQWQHIDYLIQTEFKKEILTDILKRLGRFKEIPPINVIHSPNVYDYRSRIQLKIKDNRIGFFEMKSHRLIDIDKCPIAHPIINKIINLIKKERSLFSQIEQIEINVSPEEAQGILILQNFLLDPRKKEYLMGFLNDHPILKGIAIKTKGGIISLKDPFLFYKISFTEGNHIREVRFRISPGSFYQINLEQNQKLVETVLEFSNVHQDEIALDLYSGVGNFTIPISYFVKEAIGIEASRNAFDDACFNIKLNGINRCFFIHERVENFLSTKITKKPNLVLIDPPRIGCKSILDALIKIKPERIVYISCEPTTLSRDLRLMYEKGYSLKKISLIDMFPQTYHMEVVALIKLLY